MIETITQFYESALTFTKSNPVIAGAASLWGLGVLTYVCRTVPFRVYSFVKRQIITTVTVNNTDAATGGSSSEYYYCFCRWFMTTKWSKWSRNLAITNSTDRDSEVIGRKPVLSIGFGLHFFFYNNRLFWFTVETVPSNGTYIEKERIYISTFGRSHQSIIDLLSRFQSKDDESKIKIYQSNSNEWHRIGQVPKRDWSTVVLDKKIKCSINNTIQKFTEDKEWFARRGLPYKLTFLISGPPGTGKTSFIKALASKFNRNLCILNLISCTNSTIQTLLSGVPKNSFVLIEDVDNCVATLKEDYRTDVTDKDTLNYGTILNVLDGAVPLDNVVIFITTNHPEKIRESLLRKGRIDHAFVFRLLCDNEIREYIQMMFPDENISTEMKFAEISGADLQSIYLEHRSDFQEFVKNIPRLS